MKSIPGVAACLTVLLACHSICSGQDDGRAAAVEFVGTTPCGRTPQQFLGVAAAGEHGEKITWQLTFFTRQPSDQPSTYKLVATYGAQAQNAPGFVNGGTTVELQGNWEIVKGTKSNPDAVVYRIKTGYPERSLSLVKLNDNLLHVLDTDKSLLVGNDSWSYLLNRKGVGWDK